MWDNSEANKPQVKSGWGTAGGSAGPVASNMGMAQKSAAASYWENKTTEIEIPEMGEERVMMEVTSGIAEPPSVD